MSQAVQIHEPESVTVLTPMELISRALASNADAALLERLMALQERYEANQARRAFDAALSAAKAEIPVIRKNREVGFQHKGGNDSTNYRHEDMGEIARTVDPILAKHGLSYRFRTTSAIGEPVSVTCIVSHRLGHSEENTLHAGRDDSGKKNSIQQVGSTLTYLQRYTLKAALGLASAHDDDGKAADPRDAEPISDEQLAKVRALCVETQTDIVKFCEYLKVESLADITAKDYPRALGSLETKRRKQGAK